MDLHHPAVESLVLPGLLALLLTGLARAVVGPDRRGLAAALGSGLAIVMATTWMSGWSAAPVSSLGRLPWLYVAALVAGVALARRRPAVGWLVTAVMALAGSIWLGGIGGIGASLFAALGLLLAAALARTPPQRADGAAILAIAGVGLGGSALAAGSLALFQQAVLIAAATGGTALWLWPRPRLAFGPAAVVSVTLAWLFTTLAATRTISLAAPTIVLLALGILVAALGSRSTGEERPPRRPARQALWRPLLAGLIALAFAAAAVGWQHFGAVAVSSGEGPAGLEDPYLQ